MTRELRSVRTEAEIYELVQSFEACTFPLGCWNHREHLTVAVWYLRRLPPEKAIDRMRLGIRRFNTRHGVQVTQESGYHETLTVFLVRKISMILKRLDPNAPLPAVIEQVCRKLSDWRAVVREHYSRARIMSWEARRGWMEPDLKPVE